MAAYSNLSLDKLTTYTQTQHLKREKKKRERGIKRERKEGRKKADFLLNFEVSPQKRRQKGNSATLHFNMESRSSYQAQYISLKLLSKLASFNSSLN